MANRLTGVAGWNSATGMDVCVVFWKEGKIEDNQDKEPSTDEEQTVQENKKKETSGEHGRADHSSRATVTVYAYRGIGRKLFD